ncbi:hypothetical protein [Tengunoibacter tsumagoiensis]|uniref:Lipoprotein LpqB beta-propeller domain-containing protein n=1 Tax=Tengunoibacter tsumagoiensis TaxID=2014871 RepID=A0A402A6T0_9CHLR|nr:hypothetical protein [Tengunoibacter tsumagoiensis]GCE14850.1 hypothetical protein KTT_47090 [Tengunoibacter tsumagoiensis]
MLKRSQRISIFSTLSIIFFVFILTACANTPANPGDQVATTSPGGQGTAIAQTATHTTPGPFGDTSCPAANTARAAVLHPLALGSHQNLVYIYNDVPANTSTSSGVLRRYDAATSQKVDIVTSGLRIDQAQVSHDGQWILFLSIPDPRGDHEHSALLQLVRMDGQGLQTLYCFPNATYSGQGTSTRLPISIQWSEDQHTIAFSTNINNDTSTITLLNVTNGHLTTLLSQHDSLYTYRVLTWLDQKNVYILKEGGSAPTPPATLYVMDVTTASPALVNVMTTDTRMSYYSFDSSPDGSKLFSSYCLQAANPYNSTVSSGPAKGGTRTTFFQGTPQDCVQVTRAISSSKLLLLAHVATEAGNAFSNDVWTMDATPGANYNIVSLLSVSPDDATSYDFNESTQFSWSNMSRDSSFYALQSTNPAAKVQSILIGPLAGGDAKAIATTPSGLSTVNLVGWTTM